MCSFIRVLAQESENEISNRRGASQGSVGFPVCGLHTNPDAITDKRATMGIYLESGTDLRKEYAVNSGLFGTFSAIGLSISRD